MRNRNTNFTICFQSIFIFSLILIRAKTYSELSVLCRRHFFENDLNVYSFINNFVK